MLLTIHRGASQIGGCVTEIKSGAARILIDMGSELPSGDGLVSPETMEIPGITAGEPDCDGVFFTHQHGDHIGQIDRILPGIPLYLGNTGREMHLALNERLNKIPGIDKSETISALNRAHTFTMEKPVKIKHIKVTPYWVDHSAFDAYMFLIEAEGLRILHTGDFRNHGFRGKAVEKVLAKLVKQVDWLICEGTMLSRPDEKVMTEKELQEEARKLMRENQRVFVLCSSMNIDRIASFINAIPDSRPIVIDEFQSGVLDIITKNHGHLANLYNFAGRRIYSYDKFKHNSKLDQYMNDCGFLTFIRTNSFSKKILEKHGHDALIVYSMWKGYLAGSAKDQKMVDILSGRNWIYLHTSGHATRECLKLVYDTVKPRKGIIPIHSEAPEVFQDLFPDANVVLPADGEIIEL